MAVEEQKQKEAKRNTGACPKPVLKASNSGGSSATTCPFDENVEDNIRVQNSDEEDEESD